MYNTINKMNRDRYRFNSHLYNIKNTSNLETTVKPNIHLSVNSTVNVTENGKVDDSHKKEQQAKARAEEQQARAKAQQARVKAQQARIRQEREEREKTNEEVRILLAILKNK